MRRKSFQRLIWSSFSSSPKAREDRWRLWRDGSTRSPPKAPANLFREEKKYPSNSNREAECGQLLAELKQCGKNLRRLKELHFRAVEASLISNQYVGNSLITRYAKCGSMADALEMFNKMSHPDVVSWNSLLQGYVENGESSAALKLFNVMNRSGISPDARTYVAALKACTTLAGRRIGSFGIKPVEKSKRLLEKGEFIHSEALRTRCCNSFVENTLINLYSACGSMKRAREVFNGMKFREVVTWNTLIQGYVDNDESEVALELFEGMECSPDPRTYVAALAACGSMGSKSGRDEKWLEKGRGIHSKAVMNNCCDRFVESILVDMYSKCGSMVDARRVFDGVLHRDTVCWTVLLQGYVDNGEPEVALELFEALKRPGDGCRPDARTYGVALTACASLASRDLKWLDEGRALYSQAVDNRCCDMFVESKLVDMYAKFGQMREARGVFDKMPRRDVVSWTALLQGYVDIGENEMVLEMFDRMEAAGGDCRADGRAFVLALSACGALAGKDLGNREKMLERGKALLSGALNRKCYDVFVANSMITLFAKCGMMAEARRVFDEKAFERTGVTWNCLIQGYVDNGENQAALELFSEMKNTRRVSPDAGTYVAAITACGNLMALETAEAIHEEVRACGLENDVLVGTCLISFYSRCGSMDAAKKLFDSIEVRDQWAWNTMLGGFTRKGETSQVFELFERMNTQEIPPNEITFIHLLTACSQAGLTDKGKELFGTMKSRHGVAPDVMHYSCLIDLLARCNRLEEALTTLRGMPFDPDVVIWRTLLGACRKWNNVSIGELAYKSILELDEQDSAAYVLMASIYRSSGMADKEAEILRNLETSQRPPEHE